MDRESGGGRPEGDIWLNEPRVDSIIISIPTSRSATAVGAGVRVALKIFRKFGKTRDKKEQNETRQDLSRGPRDDIEGGTPPG